MNLRGFELSTRIGSVVMVLLTVITFRSISQPVPEISEFNADAIDQGSGSILIENITIIDGISDEAIENGVILVEDGIIKYTGKRDGLESSQFDEVIDGRGKTALPGYIDSHFHYDDVREIPTKFLKNGVTSVRDPGEWFSSYDIELESGLPLPRLFLTGPHLEVYPSLYPEDAYTIADNYEAKRGVQKVFEMGSSAIKVYSRTPAGMIKAICEQADMVGIPVTAHLDATEAVEAINVGLDGVEHIYSFTQSLMSPREAEQFKQSVLALSESRRNGGYQTIWAGLDLANERVESLIDFLKEAETFITPTLAASEYQLNNKAQDSTRLKGFQQMMEFTAMLIRGKAKVVIGSHGPWVPYAERGWSFQHEMELFSECGMPTMDIIKAGTIENARFFRVEDRLGSLEEGKQADIVILNGNPLEDLKAIYDVEKVMLNGVWIER